MSSPTNPRLEVCSDIPQSLQELASIMEPNNHLGSFSDVPPGSSFRIVVGAEVSSDVAPAEPGVASVPEAQGGDCSPSGDVNPREQYFILRRSGENESRWYPWRLHAGDAVEGRPVIPYGAVTEDGAVVDMDSIVRGMGCLFAEIDLHPFGEPAPAGAKVIAEGVLATRFINLGIVKRTIGLPAKRP